MLVDREYKFSSELVYAAIVFMRACRKERGEEFANERVNAMMDSFDPELKSQIFMQLLLGDIGVIVIRRVISQEQRKISAIKAVRLVTGWGLKESKDFIDAASEEGSRISGSFALEQIRELQDSLVGTGYAVN